MVSADYTDYEDFFGNRVGPPEGLPAFLNESRNLRIVLQ